MKKIYYALIIKWDGEDVKATELMNIPTQSLINIVTNTCNCHFSATLSSENIPEKKKYAVPLKTSQKSWLLKKVKKYCRKLNLKNVNYK